VLISQAADPGHQFSPANAVWQGFNHSQWTYPHKFVKEAAGWVGRAAEECLPDPAFSLEFYDCQAGLSPTGPHLAIKGVPAPLRRAFGGTPRALKDIVSGYMNITLNYASHFRHSRRHLFLLIRSSAIESSDYPKKPAIFSTFLRTTPSRSRPSPESQPQLLVRCQQPRHHVLTEAGKRHRLSGLSPCHHP
jgi:hypothetical protein